MRPIAAVFLPEAGQDQVHVVTEESLRRIVTRLPDASPSYEWHPGGEVTLEVEVRTPSEPSALYRGAALLLEALPPPPRTTIVEFGAKEAELGTGRLLRRPRRPRPAAQVKRP